MEILYYLIIICLIGFMIIATYDGLYLHLWKYELFKRNESKFEHKTHTVRAVLFPLILWFLFINEDSISFWFGISLFIIDLIILGIDAFSEKDSRKSIGGLPRWEYILHLFSNAFHFSAIILVLALKIKISPTGLIFVNEFVNSPAKELFTFVSLNVIPGAIILAVLHFALMVKGPQTIWNTYRTKITCC